MKRIFIIAIVILLILVLVSSGKEHICASKAKVNIFNNIFEIVKAETKQSALRVIINEQSDEETGTFYLGMDKQKVLNLIKSMGIDYDAVYTTDDFDDWNYGDEVMSIDKLDCTLTFGKKDNKVYSIDVSKVPTSLGLKSGDSLEVMEKLYGKNYTVYHDGNRNIYEYKIGNHYFQPNESQPQKGIINGWSISKYSYEQELNPYIPDTDSSPLKQKILKSAYAGYMNKFPGGKKLPLEKQQEEIAKANSLSDEGFSLYRAHNDPAAVNKYEEALIHYASAEIYYRYGNSLSNVSRLEDAVKAYLIAGNLGYDKSYLVDYNIACVFSRMHKSESAFINLELAINNGYKNFSYIEKDPDLAWLRSQPEWKNWWAKHKK